MAPRGDRRPRVRGLSCARCGPRAGYGRLDINETCFDHDGASVLRLRVAPDLLRANSRTSCRCSDGTDAVAFCDSFGNSLRCGCPLGDAAVPRDAGHDGSVMTDGAAVDAFTSDGSTITTDAFP